MPPLIRTSLPLQLAPSPTLMVLSPPCGVPVRKTASSGFPATTTTRAFHYLTKQRGGKWELKREGKALERTFKFRKFSQAWDFMTAISIQAKLHNHHPEWSNVYNHVFVRWTTHDPPSLSRKDMRLARLCDELAAQMGEQTEKPSPKYETAAKLEALADKAEHSASKEGAYSNSAPEDVGVGVAGDGDGDGDGDVDDVDAYEGEADDTVRVNPKPVVESVSEPGTSEASTPKVAGKARNRETLPMEEPPARPAQDRS